jgi:hypothetical protein
MSVDPTPLKSISIIVAVIGGPPEQAFSRGQGLLLANVTVFPYLPMSGNLPLDEINVRASSERGFRTFLRLISGIGRQALTKLGGDHAVDFRNDGGSLSHGCRNTFGRAGPYIADGEDARATGLKR